MKPRVKELFPILVVIIMLWLPSCVSLPAPAPPSIVSPAPSPLPSPLPEVTYHVKTDYSKLTPYQPPEQVFTRLSPDPMPQLAPSKDYGPLLPYVGARYYGIMGKVNNYGFVTPGGIIVTDPVYARITKGYQPGPDGKTVVKSAYCLAKAMSGSGPRPALRYAVCAVDGSWISPFDYVKVFLFDQVMLLFRDGKTNDFDAMDYDGKILYNSKRLDCYAKLRSIVFYHPEGEPGNMRFGDGYLSFSNKTACAFLEEKTGRYIQTDYSEIGVFSDGLAAVKKDGLWGYIDKSFSIVSEPQFKEARDFRNGKAVVRLADGDNGVIDQNGALLYRSGYHISNWQTYFQVSSETQKEFLLYDCDLNLICDMSNADLRGLLPNGYFYVRNKATAVLCGDIKITIPGEYYVIWMTDKCIFLQGKENRNAFKLMTLQGEPIAEYSQGYVSYSDYRAPDGEDYLILYQHSMNRFSIIDSAGRTISSGIGRAAGVGGAALFAIDCDQSFAYMDLAGKAVFRVSLMGSIPD